MKDLAKQRVNYDEIAPTYDQRFTSDQSKCVGSALLALARKLGADCILEAGCGTCHWLTQMQAVSHNLYGLDLSAGMLNQARSQKTPAQFTRGYARLLPFKGCSFDFIFCINAIHHFEESRAFIAEAFRILKPDGALAIVGNDPHGRKDSWYVYHYFEGTYETDLKRFPAWDVVFEWMAADGFKGLEFRQVERILEIKHGLEVLDDPFLQKNACSQLALLTDEDYTAGLKKINTVLEKAEDSGETPIFRSDISLTMLTGYKV